MTTRSTQIAAARRLANNTPVVKTGILIGVSGIYGTVNINGQVLTLPMLDHLASAISLGTLVACQVQGNSGIIIGSLGTVSRTANLDTTIASPNPQPPKPTTSAIYYSTYFPTDAATYNTTTSTWYQATSNAGTGNNGFGALALGSGSKNVIAQDTNLKGLFVYGQNRFSDMSNKTIKSVEIFVPSAGTGSTSYKFYSHTHAAIPAGAPTLSNGPSTVSAVGGWISMPSTMFASFQAGTAGLAIFGSPNATIYTASPYGTIRIGWTR